MKRIVVGVSGASGAPYAQRLLSHLASRDDVEADVVGVVISHPRKVPDTYASTAAFSASRVASQLVLSKKKEPKQPMFSALPFGPVTSVTTLFNASAVSSQLDAPPASAL